MPAEKSLTRQQEAFVYEYIKDFNGTKAAIAAGYSEQQARTKASRLLKDPRVKAVVDKVLAGRAKSSEITAALVLNELKMIAFADISLAYDRKGHLLPIHDMPEEIRRVISSVDMYKDFTEGVEIGETQRIKFHDKLKALELLCKHLGLLKDQVSLTAEVSTHLTMVENEALEQTKTKFLQAVALKYERD